MPRRAKSKAQKRDWRYYASFALNGAVVVSMLLGTIFVFTGASLAPKPAVPTISVPTLAPGASTPAAAPTATPAGQPAAPNPAPPSPTPKASLDRQAPSSTGHISLLGIYSRPGA